MNCDLHQVSAGEIMSPTVHWTTEHERLRAAGERMLQHGVRALLVAGPRAGDLPGIVTSKDVVNLLGDQDPSVLDELTVRDVMTRPAICVPRQTSLVDCIRLMRSCGVRRMPVLDGTQVVGILSSSDVFGRVLRSC
jgi:CBS domain-containing protein